MLPFNGLASRVTGRRGWLQAMDFSGYNPRLQCEVGPDALGDVVHGWTARKSPFAVGFTAAATMVE